ncbi:hypothetical protein PVAP13_3NG313832 [Panicum virgatum]|uniref:Uncharacterized protein n=1 Tax=Panicum virgatum TaxID=38727 RepID=A0A8T0UCB3_PANVG|nr:hypothetical protein PVAP13_3NG313832 [Panicum virgatum]
MWAEVVADGQPPLPSTDVVSKVPLQNSSNNTFLKNASIPTPSSKSLSAREEALRRELDAEKQELKKKTKATEEVLERTARHYDELKRQHEERHRIVKKILHVNTTGVTLDFKDKTECIAICMP